MIANEIINKEFDQILKSRFFKSENDRTRFINSLNDDILVIPVTDPFSKEGRALKLIESARYLDDSKGIVMAREALEIDPNCIEAYNYLGECEDSDSKAIAYYKKGISLGRKILGRDYFKENRGLFCSIPETRPFMECLAGYASILESNNIVEEAIRIFELILSLNIKDHLHVRHPLMLLLIKSNNHKKFTKYERRFSGDDCIHYHFNRTLFYYKTTGDSKIANELLNLAISKNSFVVPSLVSVSRIKRLPDTEDKALTWGFMYSLLAKDYWIQTEGAINWLRKKINIRN